MTGGFAKRRSGATCRSRTRHARAGVVVAASVGAGAHARNAVGSWVGAGRAIGCCALSFAATAASARADLGGPDRHFRL